MTRFFLVFFTVLLSLSVMVSTADAKRFGGSRSIGKQRVVHNYTAPSHATTGAQTAKPQSGASRWLGPLAGLAIGGLLASLFMGHGLGGGLLTALIIGLIIFAVLRFIRRGFSPGTVKSAQYASSGMNNTSMPFTAHTQAAYSSSADFDTDKFLRGAKALFIRLQAAYDTKNLSDVQEFTIPEIFAEIRLQMQERGEEKNFTDVVTLNAELLEVVNEGAVEIASVLFSGLIREAENMPAESFKEIWHFQKNRQSSWLVAGIQQLA